MSEADQLVPVSVAARRLGVPARWLRGEALAGRVPSLSAGARIIVHLPTVAEALARRARGEGPEGEHQ